MSDSRNIKVSKQKKEPDSAKNYVSLPINLNVSESVYNSICNQISKARKQTGGSNEIAQLKQYVKASDSNTRIPTQNRDYYPMQYEDRACIHTQLAKTNILGFKVWVIWCEQNLNGMDHSCKEEEFPI